MLYSETGSIISIHERQMTTPMSCIGVSFLKMLSIPGGSL